MSYRIKIYNSNLESFQIFGNNEYPDEFFNWIRSQSISVDEDFCVYNLEDDDIQPIEITDIQGLLECIESNSRRVGNASDWFNLSTSKISTSLEDKGLPDWYIAKTLLDFRREFFSYNVLQFLLQSGDVYVNLLDYSVHINPGKHIYIAGF